MFFISLDVMLSLCNEIVYCCDL